MTDTIPLRVFLGRDDTEGTVLDAPAGAVLRDVLLDNDVDPHGRYASRLNCGGRGLCATCGVRVLAAEGDSAPDHWHDRLADRFGYPRLSCQLTVEAEMSVRVLPEKRVWGRRE
jgi:ferredoxin